ncbi:MAG: RtcB family protein [Bacteroidia bacterium]
MAKIKKKHVLRIGYPLGEAANLAVEAMKSEKFEAKGREVKLQLLQAVLSVPEQYYKHQVLGPIAHALKPIVRPEDAPIYPELLEESVPTRIFGLREIERGALDQMDIASKLPVARQAALMPDAHQGYGLPIGGVLATENAIIPYAVGVDIGCRMCLTVYDLPAKHLERNSYQLKEMLVEHTVFGAGKGPEKPMDDAVLERSEFETISVVKALKDKAWRQIGSSGGGNHFVEFGLVDLMEDNNEWGLSPGTYVGILSHSGSRGMGAKIANHYTQLAMERTKLPKHAKHLAWLDMNSAEGQEYWLAMNLAGDYASACHHHIHHRLSKAMGVKPVITVENHHNFAWEEELADGTKVYVHRKGATPAGKGVMGIIPGSMTAPGFIVRGRGEMTALQSASHGAGRLMSRTRAKSSITRSALNKILREHKVTLIGGGLDEAPIAYKDIHKVMAHQKDLIEVIGSFQPRIVRMAKD